MHVRKPRVLLDISPSISNNKPLKVALQGAPEKFGEREVILGSFDYSKARNQLGRWGAVECK